MDEPPRAELILEIKRLRAKLKGAHDRIDELKSADSPASETMLLRERAKSLHEQVQSLEEDKEGLIREIEARQNVGRDQMKSLISVLEEIRSSVKATGQGVQIVAALILISAVLAVCGGLLSPYTP